MRLPEASREGLAPAECKDQSVFVFISEEIKKKKKKAGPGLNVQQVFPLLFLPWPETPRWQNVDLFGPAAVPTLPWTLPPSCLPLSLDGTEQETERGSSPSDPSPPPSHRQGGARPGPRPCLWEGGEAGSIFGSSRSSRASSTVTSSRNSGPVLKSRRRPMSTQLRTGSSTGTR